MSYVDPKYSLPNRRQVRVMLTNRVDQIKSHIKSTISGTDYLSMTVDIWSDRCMRGYLGITCCGIVSNNNEPPTLQSFLLSCKR